MDRPRRWSVAARVDGVAAATGVISGDAHLLGATAGWSVVGRAPLGRSVDASFAGRLRAGRLPGRARRGRDRPDGPPRVTSASGVGDRVGVVASVAGEVRTVAVCAACWTRAEIPDAVVLVGYDPATARRELAPEPGRVSHLEVHAAAGVGARAAPRPRGRRPRPRLPGVHRAPSWPPSGPATPPRTRAATARSSSIAGVVALLTGMFLIRNTFGDRPRLPGPGAGPAALPGGEPRPSSAVRSWSRRSIVGGRWRSLAGLVAGIGARGRVRACCCESTDEAGRRRHRGHPAVDAPHRRRGPGGRRSAPRWCRPGDPARRAPAGCRRCPPSAARRWRSRAGWAGGRTAGRGGAGASPAPAWCSPAASPTRSLRAPS